jgi:cell division protein FtsI/penicillin-binding protein 2
MPRPRLAGSYFALVFVFLSAGPSLAQTATPALQSSVARAMAGQHGAAVVLDARSGHVLATYHPQVAARRLAYPGSSIKPFTLLALLEAGKIDAHTALVCKRPLTIAGHKLDCPHPATAEPLDPIAALAYSCNSYFTSVATRLTPQQLRDSFVRDGFETVTGLATDESAGNVDLAHSPEELQLQAIGEWGIKVTPLELVRAYRNVALLSQSNVHTKAAVLLFQGLQGSVAYGMARAAQPASGMKAAGKTGTARVEEGAWTHGWFAGYAPTDNPEIVLVVFLEKGHGSDAAAIAREIFEAFADSAAMRPEVPQRLKPAGTNQRNGTAETVPFRSRIYPAADRSMFKEARP